MTTATGNRVQMSHLENQYKDLGLIGGIDYITKSHQAQQLIEYSEKGE